VFSLPAVTSHLLLFNVHCTIWFGGKNWLIGHVGEKDANCEGQCGDTFDME